MIEMLGVLSIGGLAGYTMAMNRHKANQILDYISRCAVIAQTYGNGDIDTSIQTAVTSRFSTTETDNSHYKGNAFVFGS